MRIGTTTLLAASISVLGAAASAAETTSADAASLKGRFYGVVLVATTIAYRPPPGPFQGPLKDVSPEVGAGYFPTETLAIELDLGPTLVEGSYASFELVPAVIWSFHPNFYAAGRFIIPVHPQPNLVLVPGVGATYAFANGLAPFLEMDILSTVGRGRPDFGVALALGATCLF